MICKYFCTFRDAHLLVSNSDRLEGIAKPEGLGNTFIPTNQVSKETQLGEGSKRGNIPFDRGWKVTVERLDGAVHLVA